MGKSSIERQVMLSVKQGFERMSKFKRGRAMYLRQYVGHYYRGGKCVEGEEPINMIYHVIRSLVPNLVMRNPINKVTTEFPDYKAYAYMMGLALDNLDKTLDLKTIIRRAIVDALFAMGIVKVGINDSDSLIDFGDTRVDPGQVYCDNVDFDDFVIDTHCKRLEEAAFMGHRMNIPRSVLLEDDRFDEELVMKLPKSRDSDESSSDKVANLTRLSMVHDDELASMNDYVDIVELYLPSENTVITIPDPFQHMCDKYLSIQDYYGPKHGPYRFLSLSQPVPNNPFPIAPVGIWYDLHMQANELMVKQMERAKNQKTLFVVDPGNADQAEDMRDASDGEIIMGDPNSVETVSTTGAEVETDRALGNLQTWFNYMAGNPDQMAGVASGARTATQATILEGNANIVSEDRRGMIYDFTAGINGDMAWFLHYDPLIKIPLVARSHSGESTPFKPGEGIVLTPEQRRGDHFDYAFSIRPRSMRAIDPNILNKTILEFATNVVPALCMSAQQCMMLGVPFNLQRSITQMADQFDLADFVQDWFDDPEFLARIQYMQALGPAPEGKAMGMGMSPRGMMQNNGPPMANPNVGDGGNMNVQAQQIAGVMQSAMKGPGGY